MSTQTAETIHATVREHYGARARGVANTCCGPTPEDACCSTLTTSPTSASCCSPLYSLEELATIPDDAASLALGCGNPTAIASLQPGEVVLDLGSGGGIDVFLAARKVGATGFVYGVDMTDDMLALARRNMAKHGIANVEFRKGQIEAIPLPDASVDVVISNCVINLSPDKAQTLNEAFRVLRPGGRLAVSDIVIDGTLSDLPVSEATIRQALSWAGCIAGALTKTAYEQLLAAAGFEAIAVTVSQRYTLEGLGIDVNTSALPLSPALAQELVSRFTSSLIAAKRPQAA